MTNLTKLQEAFCHEYVADTSLNKTQAATRAGYAARCASVTATNLWKDPKIRARVAELSKERFEKSDELKEKVIRTLCSIIDADLNDFYDEVEVDLGETDALDEPVLTKVKTLKSLKDMQNMAAVAGMEPSAHGTKLKLLDKKAALDLLGRHLALFTDKVELSGSLKVLKLSDDEQAL